VLVSHGRREGHRWKQKSGAEGKKRERGKELGAERQNQSENQTKSEAKRKNDRTTYEYTSDTSKKEVASCRCLHIPHSLAPSLSACSAARLPCPVRPRLRLVVFCSSSSASCLLPPASCPKSKPRDRIFRFCILFVPFVAFPVAAFHTLRIHTIYTFGVCPFLGVLVFRQRSLFLSYSLASTRHAPNDQNESLPAAHAMSALRQAAPVRRPEANAYFRPEDPLCRS
jgi:hypothetical protein